MGIAVDASMDTANVAMNIFFVSFLIFVVIGKMFVFICTRNI